MISPHRLGSAYLDTALFTPVVGARDGNSRLPNRQRGNRDRSLRYEILPIELYFFAK